VYLIGAGPGEPGLITVKGQAILRQAEVVIYDYLVDKRLLSEVKPQAQLICCDTLGKKRYSAKSAIRNSKKVNALVVKKVLEGKKVVRLKNGDLSIFSRLSDELESLRKNKITFELVPGVTAASAAAAYSGIPLTDRQYASSCAFVTGTQDPLKKESPLDWREFAQAKTIVFYMGVKNLALITEHILATGKPNNTPVLIAQGASLLIQKTFRTSLGELAEVARREKLKPPAIIIIGKVANLEKKFGWLRGNKKVLFTGLSRERFFLKESYFHLPLIQIEPLNDYREFDRDLINITDYDWIVFCSRYGVKYFFERLKAISFDSRVLEGIRIAAVGNSTKLALLRYGIIADLLPKEESAQGLLRVFKKIELKGKSIFLPRSDLSDKGLSVGLRRQGAKVKSGIAYRNVFPQNLPKLNFDFFDKIIFTSPSGVRNFFKRYGLAPKNISISCIGKVTETEAKKLGLI